ncbi:DUF1707 SHOCT-like domain-containing protein [Rugosimonospora africana]|uniref:Cell wall-active antibiotics response LiaF-like C-terminal domain-containing protein n=1 Tax=Rugosimonospora africana TaxID=556532 RepID=A0A8J3QQ28_9ACTN|nr:DUF1707 domain-containing protein [Rugosimonospora africana]GIH13086.1 hypothetical protein Raf01_12580 [Rugosimonospora africana]
MSTPISDVDRERAAERLQHACGDGRLTLEEFTVRVGAVWAADSSAELERATGDLAPAPVVGITEVERVTCVFSENKRRGRWRMPGVLRVLTVFGDCELDLREAQTDAEVVEINGRCVFGSFKVIVPEGVEVDLQGSTMFGSKALALAPVPRLPGTPVVRVKVNTYFGEIKVRSQGPNSGSALARWAREFFGA